MSDARSAPTFSTFRAAARDASTDDADVGARWLAQDSRAGALQSIGVLEPPRPLGWLTASSRRCHGAAKGPNIQHGGQLGASCTEDLSQARRFGGAGVPTSCASRPAPARSPAPYRAGAGATAMADAIVPVHHLYAARALCIKLEEKDMPGQRKGEGNLDRHRRRRERLMVRRRGACKSGGTMAALPDLLAHPCFPYV